MSGDDKTEACTSWLRGRGIELTAGQRSLIAGFFALAGRRPVTADDIARGIELARGAAISEDAQLDQLGAHVLAFEAARAGVERGDPPAAPRVVAAVSPERIVGPAPATVEPVPAAPRVEVIPAAPPDEVAPLKLTIRVTAQTPVVAPSAELIARPGRDRAGRRWPARLRPRTLAVTALAAAAVAGVIYGRGSPAPVVPAAGVPARVAAPEPALRLRRVDLGVRLPAGWREARDSELGAAPDPHASVVFRGATPADPDHGLFVAAVARGDDLVAAARIAERGVIRQLGIDASAYHPAGCALIELASGRAGRCRGIAEHLDAPVAVEIYVRTVGGRNVVALSLAKPSRASAANEAAAIVASFTP